MKKTIVITIEGNQYTISFPTIGQMFEIESKQNALSGNAYYEMISSPLKKTQFLVDAIDAISTFFTLIPELRKDMGNKSITELDSLLVKKSLVKAYKKQYKPWYEAIEKDLYLEEEPETAEEDLQGFNDDIDDIKIV